MEPSFYIYDIVKGAWFGKGGALTSDIKRGATFTWDEAMAICKVALDHEKAPGRVLIPTAFLIDMGVKLA